MAVTPVERLMSRRQVDAQIESDPIWVVFRRRSKVAAPGGGWRWGPETSLQPQEVTLIPFKRRMTEFLVNTELGQLVDLPYILLARHDADVERGDLFSYGGSEYEVKTLDPLNQDEKKLAQVDYYGGSS